MSIFSNCFSRITEKKSENDMETAAEHVPMAGKKRAAPESLVSPQPPPSADRLTLDQAGKMAEGRSFELIDGRMVFKMADNKHSDAQGLLCGELINYFRANSIGRVRPEFTLRLWPENPYEGRTPDLSVILNENFKEERYGSRAPDLAIEIISQDDAWSALFEKADLYFEKGSRIVWFVDPYRQGVMIVTPDDQRWVKDTLTCPELLPGFSVKVRDIFTWPPAPAKSAE
jgi:Uma2 family endonuclease